SRVAFTRLSGPVRTLRTRRRPLGASVRGAFALPQWSVLIEAVRGDITTQDVAAIVNAATSGLLGGGGVDGAIHAAAGPELLAACRELRRTTLPDGLPVGDAVATPGFRLPARWVVHTVGPNLHRGQSDPVLLSSC